MNSFVNVFRCVFLLSRLNAVTTDVRRMPQEGTAGQLTGCKFVAGQRQVRLPRLANFALGLPLQLVHARHFGDEIGAQNDGRQDDDQNGSGSVA